MLMKAKKTIPKVVHNLLKSKAWPLPGCKLRSKIPTDGRIIGRIMDLEAATCHARSKSAGLSECNSR